MAKVEIKFVGPWRLYIGQQAVRADLKCLNDVKAFIETHFEPLYEQRLSAKGVSRKQSIWDGSHILHNDRPIRKGESLQFEDGDTLSFLPKMAGG